MINTLKKIGFVLLTMMVFSCNKSESSNTTATKDPQEVSLEQETIELKGDNGKSVFVTYFAKGENVAVKLKVDGKDHELVAKGITPNGNPIFTDGEILWEMGADSHSGKLTDKDKKTITYKEAE